MGFPRAGQSRDPRLAGARDWFCEELERDDGCQDWQVRQAKQALRIYFVNLLQRTDWRQPASTLVDENGCTNPLAALDELRRRIRTRHCSYRSERSYADWVRWFFAYCSERQGVPEPRIESETVHDYLTHLAVRQSPLDTLRTRKDK